MDIRYPAVLEPEASGGGFVRFVDVAWPSAQRLWRIPRLCTTRYALRASNRPG